MLLSAVCPDPVLVSEHQLEYRAGWPGHPRPAAESYPSGWHVGMLPAKARQSWLVPDSQAFGQAPGCGSPAGTVGLLQGTIIICFSALIYSV